jgi:hypothetical protein
MNVLEGVDGVCDLNGTGSHGLLLGGQVSQFNGATDLHALVIQGQRVLASAV